MTLLSDFAPEYLKTIGPRSHTEFERIIERYIIPHFKTRKELTGVLPTVDSITAEDAYWLHQGLKKTPVMANRVLAVLSGIIKHAERLSVRPAGINPCSMVKKFPETKRRRYLTPDEARRLSAALKEYERHHLRAVLFIYLLIYTGARPSELDRAKWEDLDGTVLRLKIHKTDKTGEERRVFLPPEAMAIVNELPQDDKYILRRVNVRYVWHCVRQKADILDLRLYDLRHTFASAALSAGYTLAQIGELLGHKSPTTTMRYAHLSDDDAKTAAKDTAERLHAAMNQTGLG